MSFKHSAIDLGAYWAISFSIAGAIAELDYQVDWILLQLF